MTKVRPHLVSQAVSLLYISAAINVLYLMILPSLLAEKASRFPSLSAKEVSSVEDTLIVMLATFCVIMFWLAYKISQGKNWARITYLVLFTLSVLSVITKGGGPFSQIFGAHPFPAFVGAAGFLLQAAASTLLVQKASSRWYREMKSMHQQS